MTNASHHRLRVIIVDDEPLATGLLEKMLSELDDIEVVTTCQNGRRALQAIHDYSPDLVFLDIQMPGLNGFDVVKAVQADIMPMVIFATAYDEFALDAFDVHAVDYLLKPFEKDRVFRAIERAKLRYKQSDAINKSPLMGAISEITKKVEKRIDEAHCGAHKSHDETSHIEGRLALKDGGEVKFIDPRDIDWIDAAGDYMCLHVGKDTHIVRTTLKKILADLNDDCFRRIHRSTVVNIKRIRSISSLPKGERMLHLDNDQSLKVSRNYKASMEGLF